MTNCDGNVASERMPTANLQHNAPSLAKAADFSTGIGLRWMTYIFYMLSSSKDRDVGACFCLRARKCLERVVPTR